MTINKDQQTMISILVTAAIERLASKKTQKELAREMGFIKPGMLSMIKTGAARIPFTKILDVALVLGIDPALLLRVHLQETWPKFEETIADIFGGILTENERDWIDFFEGVGMLAPPASPEKRQKLEEILLAQEWEE